MAKCRGPSSFNPSYEQPDIRMPHANLNRNRLGLQALSPQFADPLFLLDGHPASLRWHACLAQDHPDRVVTDAVSLSKLSKARASCDVGSDDGFPVCVIDSAYQSSPCGVGWDRDRFMVL